MEIEILTRRSSRFSPGFTLSELLIAIAIIAVLAALLLPALALAKGQAHSSACKNHLRQMGLALQMYVNESGGKYPYYTGSPDHSLDSAVGSPNTAFWWAKLSPYYSLKWTDQKYHCPGYKGLVAGLEFTNWWSKTPHSGPPFGSYAYNANGVSMPGFYKPYNPDLGLGFVPSGKRLNGSLEWGRASVPEHRIMEPSDMFSIGESRFIDAAVNGGLGGSDLLKCGLLNWRGTYYNLLFDPARHGKMYNQLFCDGHTEAINPWILFNPTNCAARWNADHQPHPESWEQ